VPIALFTIGILGVILAMNDQVGQFATTFSNDMTGANGQVGFFAWIGAIVAIAFVGKVTGLTATARLFMVLIALVFVFAQPNIWSNIATALGSVQEPTPSTALPPLSFTLPQQSANTPTVQPSAAVTAGTVAGDLASGNIGGAIGAGASLWG
jgi:hypothetical protein